MQDAARLVTADELERMPGDDYRYELVQGRLIQMSPVGMLHGVVTARLLARLAQHAMSLNLGVAVTEVGFKLAANPDTVRTPDVAFVRRDRFASEEVPDGFWTGPPDLAVEVLSPDDRPSDVSAKVAEYLTAGVRLVWVVDPDERTVTVRHRLGSPMTLAIDDELDAADVVPDFSCRVREILD